MVKASKILKKRLLKKDKDKKPSGKQFLSSGSTLLNLATTDTVGGCFIMGTFHSLVGDSDTGKTVLAFTIFQEASIDPKFDKYQLVYYNAERVHVDSLFKFFPGLKDRLIILEPDSLEAFYFDYDNRLKKGPVIGIEDSMDALEPKDEAKKFEEAKKAHEKGTKAKGDYGSKAKVNNRMLRRTVSKMSKNKSILIVISQTHDNMDAGPFAPKKTRSGGHALKFYNRWEVWLKHKKALTKSYKEKEISTLATAPSAQYRRITSLGSDGRLRSKSTIRMVSMTLEIALTSLPNGNTGAKVKVESKPLNLSLPAQGIS
jgi:RecA/RadA recombinase